MSDSFPNRESYPSDCMAKSEKALFEAWESLEKFHDDLVVVGGLAVHYHTRDKLKPFYQPAPTIDVDFGISLGADAGLKGTVRFDLFQAGYNDIDGRMVKELESGQNLYVDFLTEHPPRQNGSRNVSDITASICPGINRALEVREFKEIRGKDRFGEERIYRIPICGIGPLLVLKLNAFAKRQHDKKAKDAYDILVAVTSYPGGVDAVMRAFQCEKMAGNPAMELALKTLACDFAVASDDGPLSACRFRFGAEHNSELGLRLQADLVGVAQALLES